jgi:hypothetical protein
MISTPSSKPLSQAHPGHRGIFAGWKEIANYLGMAVRTLQRYERTGFPVHRLSGGSKGPVVSRKAELDAWINNGPGRVYSMAKQWLGEQTNRAGAKFSQVDSEIALTFSGLALNAVGGDFE